MEQNTISKKILKKAMRGSACLLLVVTLVFTSIVVGFAAEVKSKTKCETVTEGNFTTIITTTTTETMASKSVEITRLIENLQTKEVVKKTETRYENPGIGVEVISDTERNNVEGKEITTGNIEGIYDTTCYVKGIKDSSYNIQIKSDAVEKIMGCIESQRTRIETNATVGKTVNFYADLENLNTFTINIPNNTITKLKDDDYNLKVSTAYSYIEFYNKDLQKLLDGKNNNLLITLTKVETKNSLGTRIAINNGKQIIGFAPSKVQIGIGYDGSFGLDPERIELSTVGEDYKEKSIKEGISYSDITHMITFPSDTISEYWINIETVNFEDVQNHWAKKAINKWSDCGVVTGYQGKFNPNANIRRGDMAVIINKIMCYEKPAKNSFTDLKGTEYFAEAILKANAAGVLNGSGNKVRPNDNITREEAAVILCKSMGIAPEATCNTSFEDESNISSWAKDYVNALVNKGILTGYSGKVKPKESITRSETATILSNMITELVNFGEYSKSVNGNIVVNGRNTILKDMTIMGNLVIAEGVGDGDVTLENVKVNGTTVIRGGGDNSIKVKGNSALQNVDLQKQTGSVRFVMDKNAKAEIVNVNEKSEGVILEGTIQNVLVNSKAPIELQNLKAQNITVKMESAKLKVDATSHIGKIDIVKNAKNTTIDVSGEVLNVAANAEGTKVEGTGKVDIVDIFGNNVTVKTNGTQVMKGSKD